MAVFIDKVILFLLCSSLYIYGDSSIKAVTACLLAVIMTGVCQFVRQKKWKAACAVGFIILCFLNIKLIGFAPLIIYDGCYSYYDKIEDCFSKIMRSHLYVILAGLLALLTLIGGFINDKDGIFDSYIDQHGVFVWLLFNCIAILLAYRNKREQVLGKELISQRDSSTELNVALKERNKELLENQDSQIHIATLSERNRIAREIHDNVGHMLSRCILQMGALMVVHKEEPLHEQLASVNDTLNEAMTSIRKSVHNLHDESIDVKQSIDDILNPLHDQYRISFQYDFSDQVEKEVKYCVINVIKEAVTNIVKHSNATSITIILREQPAFYQLSIADNGKIDQAAFDDKLYSDGMGLKNMQERVEKLNGIIRITSESGFHIFISIPKKTI